MYFGESKAFVLNARALGKNDENDRKWSSSIERKGSALESTKRYIRYHIQAIKAFEGRQWVHPRCAGIHSIVQQLSYSLTTLLKKQAAHLYFHTQAVK